MMFAFSARSFSWYGEKRGEGQSSCRDPGSENAYVIKSILHRCQVPDSVFSYTNYTNPEDKNDIHPYEKFSSHFRLKKSILKNISSSFHFNTSI